MSINHFEKMIKAEHQYYTYSGTRYDSDYITLPKKTLKIYPSFSPTKSVYRIKYECGYTRDYRLSVVSGYTIHIYNNNFIIIIIILHLSMGYNER